MRHPGEGVAQGQVVRPVADGDARDDAAPDQVEDHDTTAVFLGHVGEPAVLSDFYVMRVAEAREDLENTEGATVHKRDPPGRWARHEHEAPVPRRRDVVRTVGDPDSRQHAAGDRLHGDEPVIVLGGDEGNHLLRRRRRHSERDKGQSGECNDG